jgi:hypothetical protein
MSCYSCKRCGKKYTDMFTSKWCKPCQVNELKKNFTNWTSGDKKIDNAIQEVQLIIYCSSDIIFEWIPYNQFSNIKKINNFFASAIWKDGPLTYDSNKEEYTRKLSNKKFTLEYLDISQNITNEFLNEV